MSMPDTDIVGPDQFETITVVLRREDAIAIVLGPLDYAVNVMSGTAPEGGSFMRARQAIKKVLDEYA